MAQKSNNTVKETLLEMVKGYIPIEIVMTPKAFSMPMSQEKTIDNFKSRVKDSFLKEHPNYSIALLDDIDSDLEYILSKRIVIGSSTPQTV